MSTVNLMWYSPIDTIKKFTSEFEKHINYTFYIENISRALLQELARHRIASLSVKSTRYTLKELKLIPNIDKQDLNAIGKYCVLTGYTGVDLIIGKNLCNLQKLVKLNIPNDITKFALPEAYKTSLTWSINTESLQNFFQLRYSKEAMWEIKELSKNIFISLPKDHKYLYEYIFSKAKI